MRMRGGILLLLSCLLGCACNPPGGEESFVRTGSKGEDGMYHFSLDLSDSTATYDISFYSRIDCNNLKIASLRDFPMTVFWTSPSGRRYSEKVYFPIQSYSAGSDFYSHQYVVPYRSGLVPAERGVWDIAVRIDSDSLIPGFRGIGMTSEKKAD